LPVNSVNVATMCVSWGVICLSCSLAIWSEIWICLMQGLGFIGWQFTIASALDVLTVVLQMVAVCLGGGLLVLSITMAIGPVLLRWLLLKFARKWRPELFPVSGKWNGALFRSLVSPSLRAWTTSAGVFVVMYSDPYLIAQLKGASQIPAYRAAWLIFYNLNAFSIAAAVASAAFVSHLWQAGRRPETQRVVMRNLRFGLSIMACGGGCVLMLGSRLFDLWLGQGNFTGYPILVIFLVVFFFETQAAIISTGSRATEDEVFALWAMAAAILKIALAIVFGRTLGLTGIALATLVALALTNHWFMTYRGLRRLEMRLGQHVTSVLGPVFLVFSATCLVVWIVEQGLRNASSWMVIGAGSGAAALVLAISFWMLTLDKSERTRALGLLALKPSAGP
jgi:O-antigen/teichoic acid export membrane protein